VAQQRTFGLTVMACFKVLTSDEKLLVGSILALSEESPRWPFTLSSANKAVPMLPMLLQALDAPIQWMYWFVIVASTVQVPAYMTGTTSDKSKNKNRLIFFIFHSPFKFFIFIPYPPLFFLQPLFSFMNVHIIFYLNAFLPIY
jgi:hypothetical protein